MKINMEQLWEKTGGKLILKQLTSFHSIGLNKQKQAYSLETTSVILLQFSQWEVTRKRSVKHENGIKERQQI